MNTDPAESARTEDFSDPPDERFVARIAAFDEALAAGTLDSITTDPAGDSPVDDRLRHAQTVLSLLEQHRRMTVSRDAGPAPQVSEHFSYDPATGQGTVGRFRLLRELGRGGGGVVFLARDPQLKREVALKIPTFHRLVDENERRRFLREAQAAAGLDHPHIVPVFDSGEAGGIGWIASAYCKGPTLTQWLRQQEAPVPPRVAAHLTAALADALEYTHRRGILHRDLKPGNILLVERESSAAEGSNAAASEADWPWIPKITDFGLARSMEETNHRTSTGTVVGTAAYMSVEQALGRNSDLGPATDLYSLGALLYELLTGQPPFQGATQLDVLRRVVEEDPLPLRQLRKDVPRELEVICLKCLRKAPAERYGSARELADDLRRFLRGEPIHARPSTRSERFLKWVRRKPATAALLAVSGVALLAGTVGAVLHSIETGRLNDDLAQALANEKKTSLQLDEQLRSLERSEARLRRQLFLNRFNKVSTRGDDVPLWRRLETLDSMCPLPGEKDGRGLEWHLAAQRYRNPARRFAWHSDQIDHLVFSPDGRLLASSGRDQSVRLWEPATGKPLGRLTGHTDAVWRSAFSPDGKTLASASHDRTVKLWDLATLQEKATLRGHEEGVEDVVFTPDGRTLISVGDDDLILLWDVATGNRLATCRGHADQIYRMVPAPDGRTYASVSKDAAVKLWELSHHGALREIRTLRGHSGTVFGAAFAPGGRLLASVGDTIRLWDPRDGTPIGTLDDPDLFGYSVAVSPDGKTLLSAGKSRTLRLWDLATRKEISSVQEEAVGKVHTMAYSPDGRWLAFGGEANVLAILDLKAPRQEPPGHKGQAWCVAFAPDGRTLASGGEDRLVKFRDFEREAPIAPLGPHDGAVHALAHSPDGNLLAVGTTASTVDVWDLGARVKRFRLRGHADRVQSVVFSPDGKTLATGSWDRTVRLWDVARGETRTILEGHADEVWSVRFSPDGRLLASAGEDRTVRIWEATSGKLLHSLKAMHKVRCLAFTPDGKMLLSANVLGSVQLWDPEAGVHIGSIHAQKLGIRSLAVSPEGWTFVQGGANKTLQLWDLASRQETLSVDVAAEVMGVAIAPDGKALAVALYDGTVRIWRADPE